MIHFQTTVGANVRKLPIDLLLDFRPQLPVVDLDPAGLSFGLHEILLHLAGNIGFLRLQELLEQLLLGAAVMCVDYLTAILARLASRDIPSSHRFEDGELRVITIGPTFAGLVAASFDQIRGSAAGNVGVILRMLGALQTIGSLTTDPSRRRALRGEVRWIAELAERTIESPHDRERFESRLENVREALEREPVFLTPNQPTKG